MEQKGEHDEHGTDDQGRGARARLPRRFQTDDDCSDTDHGNEDPRGPLSPPRPLDPSDARQSHRRSMSIF
jgi:hypothetical protein